MKYRAYRHRNGSVSISNETLSKSHLIGRHRELVLIAPSYVGVCSADVRELRGERPGKHDFGHEMVGTVLESTHTGYKSGQCVALNPFAQVDRETAFADLMYVAGSRAALDLALLRVPEARLEFSAVEPLACVIHAARQAQVMNSGPKLVFGAGFFGYLLYCYLEFKAIPVMLGNRTRERLDRLRQSAEEKGAGRIFLAADIKQYADVFSTVFLTQTRLSQEDVSSAVDLVHDHGEIILFGAIDPADSALHATRNKQQRRRWARGEKNYYVQGTLDASAEDLKESVDTLGDPLFARKIAPVFAPALTFEQGAAHLTERARSPQSYKKYVVRLHAS